MDISFVALEEALQALGQLLADRGHYYEVIAIGGGSLLLLHQIDRTTKDLDVVALVKAHEFISAEPLPLNLLEAVREIGRALELGEEWLNAGPASLLENGLPEGFKSRMHTRHYGGLTLHLAGKFDQICLKLYAAVDQGPSSKHFSDLKSLQPTFEELETARKWCITQDVSEPFAEELNTVIKTLSVADEHS